MPDPRLPRPGTTFLLLAALAGAPAAQAQRDCGMDDPDPGVLVDAAWLRPRLGAPSLVLLHAERARAAYDTGHIPGARFVGTPQFTRRVGPLQTELPEVAALDSLAEALGIGEDTRVVVYGETLAAARLLFTLEYLGLKGRVSVLDGGLAAWRAAGGAVTAEPPGPWAPGRLTPRPDSSLLATTEWVAAHRGDATVALLDARTAAEFSGETPEEGVARPGHIPGSRNLDWTATLERGTFRSGADLRQLFRAAGVTGGQEVVALCRVGSRASVLYLVSRLLGYPTRLYDGSMNAWAADAGRPVEATPKP